MPAASKGIASLSSISERTVCHLHAEAPIRKDVRVSSRKIGDNHRTDNDVLKLGS
jgi:hypothetical protein